MRNMILILTLLFGVITLSASAQETKQEKHDAASNSVKEGVEAERFIFKAQSATPAKGGVIQLTSGYEVSVSPEELKSQLPFFGRAFTGGYAGSDSGITFTSKDFAYDVKPKKKGGWDVTIKPADASQIVKLFFSITSSGYATLRITSTDRDAMSYSGVVE